MNFDADEFLSLLNRLIRERVPMRTGMDAVIEQVSRTLPHKDWDRLRAIAWEKEVARIAACLVVTLVQDPAPFPIRGLWFGLCNVTYGDDPMSMDLFLGAMAECDPADEGCQWIFGRERYFPPKGYLRSNVLAEVYAIANEEGGLGNDAEYPVCLAFAGLAVMNMTRQVWMERVLDMKVPVGLAVGFDGGDVIRVGYWQNGELMTPCVIP